MQAVILAGGEGSRLRPLTYSRPKALIPIANRPIIGHVIDALISNNIRDITVVVGYRKEQVIRYLNTLEIPVNVVVQEKQLSTANALLCARHEVKGRFLLLPGDNYISAASIAKIKDVDRGILFAEHPEPTHYGVVSMRDGYVRCIREKPENSLGYNVSTGVFMTSTDIFDDLEDQDLPEIVNERIRDGMKVRAVHAEEWWDAAYLWNLLRMNTAVLKSIRPGIAGRVSREAVISGKVSIGKGTTIGPNSTIIGPVIIGEDCTIGPNTCILPDTSIGSRVRIGPFTSLGNALIMDDVTIGSHSSCIDIVVGEGTELADHNSTVTGEHTFEEDGKIVRGDFGAIIGDRAKSAPFTVFRHCIAGNSVSIEEGRTITGMLPDHTVVR